MTIIWCIVPEIWSVTERIFLSFWTAFCLFTPLTTQKIKILKKWKKVGNFIILHMCTINDNQMMYSSWDTEHERQIFLSFWTIFCPITPLTTQNIKILKKLKKNPADIIILQMCTIIYNHMKYGSWDIEHDGQHFFVILDNFLPI